MASKGLPRRRGRRSALALDCGRDGRRALPLPRAAAVSTRVRVRSRSVKPSAEVGGRVAGGEVAQVEARGEGRRGVRKRREARLLARQRLARIGLEGRHDEDGA